MPVFNRAWLPHLVLILGVAASAVVARALWRAAESKDQARFEYYALATRDDIVSRIDTYTALLRGTVGFFIADGDVTRQKFEAFVDRLRLDDHYRGVHGIGYSPVVPADQIPAFEEEVRQQGVANFRIWPERTREEAVPILYLEPSHERNRAALGFDMWSEPERRAAMERARDTGTAAGSSRVRLVQELDNQNPPAGFLIYLPIYRDGLVPNSVEERRRALVGFAYSPFRMNQLLSGILGANAESRMQMRVYDGDKVDPAAEIHRSSAVLTNSRPRFSTTRRIEVAGQPWTLLFQSSPEFESNAMTASIPYVLIGGVLLSIVLSAVIHSQVRARTAAEKSTADLRASEEALWALNETLEQRVVKRTSEAEQRAAQLRRMAAKLTQAEQQERRRLAQVLHDHLQQLLVAARMQIGVFRRQHNDPETSRGMEQIDDLIKQSIEASRSLTIELSPPVLYDGDLAAALEWLGRQMKSKYDFKVELDVDPSATPAAQNTRVFLFESVRELLFNVFKHAGVNRAKLTLTRDGDEVRIVVADEGKGFDPDTGLQVGSESEGFGLFSIRERLQLLGGEFFVESAPGCGTRMTLTAPLGEPFEQTALETSAIAAGQPGVVDLGHAGDGAARHSGKIRVLLADDHRIVRAGLAGLLRSQPDIEIVGEASDGEMAVDLARRLQPDVVSMDITMPRMSGIEATRVISAELPHVRVVGLSMHEQRDMARAMQEAGAVAYVPKDGPADVLLAAIRNAYAASTVG